MSDFSRVVLAAVVVGWILPAQTIAQPLFRDDFDSAPLDASKWSLPSGDGSFLGRTQMRPPGSKFEFSQGVIRLQLDTYNPWFETPGVSLLGSEIDTVPSWELGDGLIIEARARLVSPIPGGLVGALFTLGSSGRVRDEIAFQLSSNDLNTARSQVLTNVFDHSDFSSPGIPGHTSLAGLDLDGFHVYRIEWFRDRVVWRIDGELVREETASVPDGAQNFRLAFWAPDSAFEQAYDEGLVPASTAADNETYYYEIDWVKIRRPLSLMQRLRPWAVPVLAGLVGLVGLGVVGWIARRARA